MSTVQNQMDNTNIIVDETVIVGDEEGDQKGIDGLNELLEQELKEHESVDSYIPLHCFIDDDMRRYPPKYRLNHEEEASVVPDASLFCPKEGVSANNTSVMLQTQLEIPVQSEKEVAFEMPNDAEHLQSCGEGDPAGAVFESTDVEMANAGAGEVTYTVEGNVVHTNGMDPDIENGDESAFVLEEAENVLYDPDGEHVMEQDPHDPANEEHGVMEEIPVECCEGTDNQIEMAEEPPDAVQLALQSALESCDPTESEEAMSATAALDERVAAALEESAAAVLDETATAALDESSVVALDETVAAALHESAAQVLDESAVDALDESATAVLEESAAAVLNDSAAAVVDKSATAALDESAAAASDESATAVQNESATQIPDITFNDEIPPEDEQRECQETPATTGTVHTNNPLHDKVVLSPVFKISTGEGKSGKDGHKPVIIRTARLIKKDGDRATGGGDKCVISDLKSFRIVKVSAVTTKAVDSMATRPSDSTFTAKFVDSVPTTSIAVTMRGGDSVATTQAADSAKTEAVDTTVTSDAADGADPTEPAATTVTTETAYTHASTDTTDTVTATEAADSADPTETDVKSGVSECKSQEDTVKSTESVESEDNAPNESDGAKEQETVPVQNGDAAKNQDPITQKVVLTRKVYRNTKKSPTAVQENSTPGTEASDRDTPSPQANTVEDKAGKVGGGVVSVKTKVVVGKRRNASPAAPVLEKKVVGSHVEKRKTDFVAVKRKFEEMTRISRQEEEAAIKEIKKMRRETLDVLKKISGEVKKLRQVFVAGK